jgi:hypothetical protein
MFDRTWGLNLESNLGSTHPREEPEYTHIYVTGYAKYFNDETSQCNDSSFSFWAGEPSKHHFGDNMTNERRTALNNLVDLVNRVMKDTANRWRNPKSGENYGPNVHLVNYEAFEGHRICEEGVKESQGLGDPHERTWFFQPRHRHQLASSSNLEYSAAS